jgi:beta-hydroxylase
MTATVAFKILTTDQWTSWRASGVLHGAPVDLSDGFIHLSAADQVAETLDKHFHGQADLLVAEIDLPCLDPLVKWEPSRGGALFPHVYGKIPLTAVKRVMTPAEFMSAAC